jgi:hypothetical protein
MVRTGRKPGLVKTKTIKKRKLEIYFSTEEEKQTLLKEAEKKGMSSSKYIQCCIQQVQSGPTQAPIQKEFAEANREKIELMTRIEALTKERDKLLVLTGRNAMELELLRTRDAPVHEEPIAPGIHTINKQLIKVLKEKKEIKGYEIIELLKLDPKDKTIGRKIMKDLDLLENYGSIEKTMDGWRWVGL